MADRRPVVATTAMITAIAAVVASIWFYTLNPRINEAVRLGSNKTIGDIDGVTFLEIYLYWYSSWGGPAFFCFLTVWLSIARRHTYRRFPSPFVWWLAVTSFAIYLPTILFPLSVVGLWALFTPETKKLIYNRPSQDCPNSDSAHEPNVQPQD